MTEYNTDNYTWTWAGISIPTVENDREQFLALAPSFKLKTVRLVSDLANVPSEKIYEEVLGAVRNGMVAASVLSVSPENYECLKNKTLKTVRGENISLETMISQTAGLRIEVSV